MRKKMKVADHLSPEQKSMPVHIYQVDAFTSEPFKGNPAAVCILQGPVDKDWMQSVAREMNLSETAFLVKEAEGYGLRWFTPTVEVDLCGHATLASAHVLWEEGLLRPDEEALFKTRSGPLGARRAGGWIVLDFPAEPAEQAEAPTGLIEAIGAEPLYVGKNRFDYLVEVGSECVVWELEPDLARLASISARGVIVTSRSSTGEFDFISRFFAPASGIDEDPVTGSAHCCLGPFWAGRLEKTTLVGYQASERGGVVRVELNGGRVKLGGQAVTILRGELF